MRDLSALPELVRDFRWEASLLPNADTVQYTTHFENVGQSMKPIETWKRERKLGQGGYGDVYLESKMSTNPFAPELRAVKQIKLQGFMSKSGRYVSELQAMAKFSRGKYTRLFVEFKGWYESPDSSFLFIAMEYCQLGDLKNYLSRYKMIPEYEARVIASQVLQGLVFMHGEGFAHRDLNPSNVLIKSQPPDRWLIKICDLGLSRRIGGDTASTARGTPGFKPPESIKPIPVDTPAEPYAADMWSFGATVFKMLTGRPAFDNDVSIYNYRQGIEEFPGAVLRYAGCSLPAIILLRSVMNADPRSRMTAPAAVRTPWFMSTTTLPYPFRTPAPSATLSPARTNIQMGDHTQVSGEWTEFDDKLPKSWSKQAEPATAKPFQSYATPWPNVKLAPAGQPRSTSTPAPQPSYPLSNMMMPTNYQQPLYAHQHRPAYPNYAYPVYSHYPRYTSHSTGHMGYPVGNMLVPSYHTLGAGATPLNTPYGLSSRPVTVPYIPPFDPLRPRAASELNPRGTEGGQSIAKKDSAAQGVASKTPAAQSVADRAPMSSAWQKIQKDEVSDPDKERVQRGIRGRDKAVKLADLRNFSSTFKLPTPIPRDLLPIIKKDEAKKQEVAENRQSTAGPNRSDSSGSSSAVLVLPVKKNPSTRARTGAEKTADSKRENPQRASTVRKEEKSPPGISKQTGRTPTSLSYAAVAKGRS